MTSTRRKVPEAHSGLDGPVDGVMIVHRPPAPLTLW